jgi:CheY-like chemotaxis protein
MEAIGRLAGGIAHDFNNLLMVMIGRADLLLVQMKEGDPALKAIEEIQKAAWRAASLTRQLLAFSRKQRLEPKILNLNHSVADMEKMLRRLIGEHITMTVETDPQLGNIKADPGGIEQVLMNLCVNARDAMPNGGSINISTAGAEFDVPFPMRHGTLAPGRYLLLAVSDTGAGMDSATQARIFEPFFTTKEPGKGTGLGLSTVYGIVQQSGGAVSVYSEPGRGTAFKIYFPVVEEAADSASRRAADASLPRGTETILLVEDEDAVRTIASEYLTVAGYTVLEARNSAQALELSNTHRGAIHLLLTDVILPGMSGRELAERLRADRPRLRVLYLSGYTADVTIAQGLLPAGSPLIEKPFRLASFASKVRSALDGAAAST